ncbi:hypothetical protein HK099_008032 [Clydaea vesicula]|uniref:Uncharacterized protein n=1 Tax=Clydaea vesicula TaxID=447962 RepID=A0AAD5Y213_9FUNG|nr:hypothetical protein HK099_008032 [Clydaea vesicula]
MKVSDGIYRSGYPNKKNFPFLKKIGLKSVMYLCDEYSEENKEFFKVNNIQIFQYNIAGNKEPFGEIDQNDMANALSQVLDTRNHPRKHRIGCLIGILRKLQNWSMTAIYDEYKRFTGIKTRIADQEV